MKVLFTVSTYYPKKDGVQNVTGYLAEGLAKLGHDVTVVTSSYDSNAPEKETHNGVKIIRKNIYTRFGMYFGSKKEYIDLIDNMANNVDVMINVCTQNAFTDLILNRLSKYKCKKILYKHDIFDFKFNKSNFSSTTSIVNKLWKEVRWFVYYNLKSNYFKKYDYVTELHKKCYGYEYFKRKYGISSIIIENAAEDIFFENTKNKEFTVPFERYIINVSNYDDRKNQKLSVKTFLGANIDKKIGLVLIGSKKNRYFEDLIKYEKRLRKKLNLNIDEKPILFLTDVDRELVSLYVKNAYLYLMTSKWEAFPISLTESLACGVPFISTNVGITRFLFGGITAYSEKDISFYIEELCNNKKIRDDMGLVANCYAKSSLRIEDKVKQLEKICLGTY